MEEEEIELVDDDEEALADGRLNRDIVEVEGVAGSLKDLLSETSHCGDLNNFPTTASRNGMADQAQSIP